MTTGIGERFAAARTAWVREATVQFEADERISAVLVSGSLGRGTADEWSDVDLVIVLARGAMMM
jgi:predicted nucleotidyltransferase